MNLPVVLCAPHRLAPLLLPAFLAAVVFPCLSRADESVLIEIGSSMRYVAPTDGGLDAAWAEPGFDDTGWAQGSYGVGYDAGAMLQTAVPDPSPSVYTRSVFKIDDLSSVESIWLGVDYDDGYAAWINGVEVARVNLPSGDLQFDTRASGNHESSNGSAPAYEPARDVTSNALPALVTGDNVLAIGAWNVSETSSDLALAPRLSINRPVTPPGELHWTLAQSPVQLATSLTIPRGTILKIDAGVEVRAASGVKIRIEGQIEAQGSADAPILFDRSGSSGSWGGLEIDHGGDGIPRESTLRFARILHASTAIDVDDTGDSSILVADCAIDSWSHLAVHWDHGANALRISRCTIGTETPASEQDHEAINGYRSNVIVEYCVFGVRRGYNDTVDLGNAKWGGPVPTLRYNEFLGGDDDAIDYDDCDGYIIGNFIHGQRPPADGSKEAACPEYPASGHSANGAGLSGNDGSRPVVLNNIIFNCFQGIGYKNGARPIIINNTIVGCDWGTVLFTNDGGTTLARGVLVNNIYWDCKVPIKLNWCDDTPESLADVRSCMLPGGWPQAGNFDISESPLASEPDIANPTRDQFRLARCSPAIDAGFSGTISEDFHSEDVPLLDAVEAMRADMLTVPDAPSFIDLGALEYQGPDACGGATGGIFVRADANGDGALDVSDAVRILFVLFEGAATDCDDADDVNDDGEVNVTDAIRLLLYLFAGGEQPPPPYPVSGSDLTADALDCGRS